MLIMCSKKTAASSARLTFHSEPDVAHAVIARRYHVAKALYESVPERATFRSLSAREWLRLPPAGYRAIARFAKTLSQAGLSIDSHDLSPATRLRYGLSGGAADLIMHMQMMEAILRTYRKESRLLSLYPPGTTFDFVKTTILWHEFGRWCGVHRDPTSLLGMDQKSARLVQDFFPNAPTAHFLHHTEHVLRLEPMPDPRHNAIPLLMKAVDTLGKPGRDPQKFFHQQGGHAAWVAVQKANGLFPITVSQRLSGAMYSSRMITAEEYARNDCAMTVAGCAYLADLVPYRPVESVLAEASTWALNNGAALIENFGR